MPRETKLEQHELDKQLPIKTPTFFIHSDPATYSQHFESIIRACQPIVLPRELKRVGGMRQMDVVAVHRRQTRVGKACRANEMRQISDMTCPKDLFRTF